jgi:hypothetical protein
VFEAWEKMKHSSAKKEVKKYWRLNKKHSIPPTMIASKDKIGFLYRKRKKYEKESDLILTKKKSRYVEVRACKRNRSWFYNPAHSIAKEIQDSLNPEKVKEITPYKCVETVSKKQNQDYSGLFEKRKDYSLLWLKAQVIKETLKAVCFMYKKHSLWVPKSLICGPKLGRYGIPKFLFENIKDR